MNKFSKGMNYYGKRGKKKNSGPMVCDDALPFVCLCLLWDNQRPHARQFVRKWGEKKVEWVTCETRNSMAVFPLFLWKTILRII
jgi:hypothetical protein